MSSSQTSLRATSRVRDSEDAQEQTLMCDNELAMPVVSRVEKEHVQERGGDLKKGDEIAFRN